jgi:hypothetical protein
MSLTTTLTILAISGGLFVFASLHAKRPADPLKPRLLPWRVIIIASGAVAIFMFIHLVNLLGFQTGQTPRPY